MDLDACSSFQEKRPASLQDKQSDPSDTSSDIHDELPVASSCLHALLQLDNDKPSTYHPFQNHYTHEITIFELFRDYSYSFQGSSELITITVTVSLLFVQNAVTGKNSPQEFPIIFCSYSYMI